MLEDDMLLALRVVKWWGSATATGGGEALRRQVVGKRYGDRWPA